MENSDPLMLVDIVKKIPSVKLLVVGDLMLDRYWWGDVTRISPEAPVPVVRLKKNTYAVGGAANVAANITGLGAKVYLAGVVGNDADAATFKDLLSGANISTECVVSSEHRPTTVKTRVIAHNQQVVRVDQETASELDPEDEEMILKAIDRVIAGVDLIIISDYAKGVLTSNILARLITKAKDLGKTVLVDPKGKDFSKYAGASLLTPNRREAAEACHLESESQDLIEKAGSKILSELDLEALLITQSEDGMTLFTRGGDPEHLEAAAREIYDVTGAGDTVIACLGSAMAAGADCLAAAKIANIGAGIVIRQLGTTHITADRLLAELGSARGISG
jgi:D-beta-D-heptose 7-phosphate kinase/D-beta-D-heptose 1-phosphate adenosyltransferase